MHQLEAIKDKRLTASGEGGIWHRGTQIRRSELTNVIKGVKVEVEGARTLVTDHDRKVRTVHLRLAEQIGNGWESYLKGLLSVVHYAEHNTNNIQDTMRILRQVLDIVMADNKVTSSEMVKLNHQCNVVHKALKDVALNQEKITLDDDLVKELDLALDKGLFEKFELPRSNDHNINDWLNSIDGWVGSYLQSLAKMRSEALELLLRSEEKVKQMSQTNAVTRALAPSVINTSYVTFMPGDERENTLKLSMWDKFISAEGIVPALTKFAVAASIVGGTVYMAGHTGMSDLSIYNGLGQTVVVDLDGERVRVKPHAYHKTDIKGVSDYEITTSTLGGDVIESFKPHLSGRSSHYIYNVARGAGLYEYRVYYGKSVGDYNNLIGNKRWLTSSADYIFQEAPEQMKTSGSGTTKDVFMALSDAPAENIFGVINDEGDQLAFLESHVLWDPSDAVNIVQWVSAAQAMENGIDLYKRRLKNYPDEIITLRTLMDYGSESDRDSICGAYASGDLSNANTFYIATRCLPDGPEKEKRYLDGASKWPDHSWMNYAASHYYGIRGDWEKCYEVLSASYDGAQGLKFAIAINSKRVARLLDAQGRPIANPKPMESGALDFYQSIEDGTDQDPFIQVFHLLNKGAVQEAMDITGTMTVGQSNYKAICAASDGAKSAWIDEAINYLPDSLNEEGIIAVAGLRLRKNMEVDAYSDRLEELLLGNDVSAMDFIAKIKAGNYTAGSKIIDEVGLASHAQMCALAYIAYGNRIPRDWKMKAKYLLFASEKPYIKM